MPTEKSLLRRAIDSPGWKPVWSVPAAMRTVRATVVVPSLFAITYKVVGDPQMALFATFGGFATLIIAGFGGTRRDKLAAHAGLAVAGSLALIIGTLVSGTTWLAAVVTVPVTFAIFFAGIGGPNAASGSTAAMFAYVLPVASAGGAATIPSRLEGWLLASAAGTIAVLLFSPHAPGSRLRAAAADLAGELAGRVRAAAGGETTQPEAMRAAKERLLAAFTAAPFRPTGLAVADQALSSLVQLLEWGASQANDAFDGHIDLANGCPADRELLRTAAGLFDDTRALLAGQAAEPDFAALETARARSAAHLSELSGRAGEPDSRLAAAQAVHAQAIAVVARAAAADALIASRRAGFETTVETLVTTSGLTGLAGAVALVRRHATFRSVWFLNSLRGAVALAAAVAVADLSGVQHGFWVVLGTLSVLRTSAASTGATAWRALAGTLVGFIIGAALLIGIGTNPDALWVVLPVAVAVAAYAPGTTPFLVGQAAFTVTVVVLFNLLAPVGWTVGLLRIEDVAIGCAVSLAVGLLFWPRGVSAVVGDDLADAFRRGAEYLTQAVEWALSELMVPPSAAVAAASAAIRLDDAVRGFLTEQGSKRMRKEDLWTLLSASSRLRLTAYTLAGLRTAAPAEEGDFGGACLPLAGSDEYAGAPACVSLRLVTAELAGFYDAVADEVSRPGPGRLAPLPPLPMVGPAMPRHKPGGADGAGAEEVIAPAHQLPHPHLLWVQEHLHHLSASAQTVREPALRVAEIRRRPWWR
jgi:Fusaric acid resistance protein-like